MHIGQMIREYLKEVGIPQNKFAVALKIKPSKLNLMLLGHRKISAEEYFTMCWALDVSPEKFMPSYKNKGA
jgi:plasmid maintenance system antidote protein VapI